MNILHIQKALPLTGNAAYRLHLKMLENDIDSNMLHYDSAFTNNRIRSIEEPWFLRILKMGINSLITKIHLRYQKKDSYVFNYPNIIGHKINLHPFVVKADVIYLHWAIGGFLNLKNMEQIFLLKKPVFIIMHDMWNITGGCHHSFDCMNYSNCRCEFCPMFIGDNRFTPASKEFAKKQKILSKYDNIYFISPSKWMDNCVSNSLLVGMHKHYIIPNVVNEKIFKYIDKNIAKNILNIDTTKITLAFGCVSMKNKFKGLNYLLDALNYLDNRFPIQLLIFGTMYQEEIIQKTKYPVRFMGVVTNEYFMSLINNASDIYISPSLAESFGLTFLENLLCNTPIIGFDNTAISEMIKHKENGYLAKNRDAKDLACGIEFVIKNLLDLDCDLKMKYNSNDIILKHLDLINNILNVEN